MNSLSRKTLKTFARIFWGAVVFLVIFVAVAVQLGRSAFPYLNDYKSRFEVSLSERLNATIEIGEITASWDGLRPRIALRQLTVAGGPHEGEMFVERVSAEVNLLATLVDWRTALGQLKFEGLVVALHQDQDGSWGVAGLPKSSSTNKNFTIDDPLDIFLFGRRIELQDTAAAFRFRTGHIAEIIIPSATLENDADFHRLKGKLDVDNDVNALYFVVEGIGDPRDEVNFTSKGYVQLQNFPLQKVVAATGLNKGLDIEPGLWSDGSRMDFQMWYEGSVAKGLRFNGGGKASGLPFALPGGKAAPAIPQFKFAGDWSKSTGLFTQIRDFALSWPEAEIPPLDISLSAGVNQPAELRVRELDVTAWSQVAQTLKLSESFDALQSALNPGGKLSNIGVTLTTPEEGYFLLRANVEHGAVDSWQGAPQVRHAAGFVESSAFKGRMVLAANDGFLMHYPVVYKKPLSFHQASGEVAWHVRLDEHMVYVTSGLLSLKGESGEGAGYLYLSIPTKRLDDVEPEMTLAVGMRESLARYHENYVPYTIPDSLYNWLGQSIKEGELRDGGFIYRGSLRGTPLRPRTLQLSMEIVSGELAFDPNWPVLKNADATLLVDDLALVVAIDQGELMGNTLTQGRVELVQDDNSKVALSITGLAEGDTKNALALLRQSPVQDVAGKALEQFQASGAYTGSVELYIPLEGDISAGWQDIKADLIGGSFELPDVGLSFENVEGSIRYHTQQGLNAESISATLWNKPVSGALKTLTDQHGKLLNLDFQGSVDVADLYGWLQRPMLEYMSGTTDVSGGLKLPFDHPAQGVELQASSEMQGITINYPAPYYKAADERLDFVVDYLLPAGSEVSSINMNSGGSVFSQLLMQGSNLLALDVGFNEPAKAKAGNIRLHGGFDEVDISAWSGFVLEYLDKLEATSGSDTDSGELSSVKDSDTAFPKFSMGVRAKRAFIDSFELTDVALWGKELDDAWYFDLETPQAIAHYQRYNNGQPSDLYFEHLHLPAPEDGEASGDKTSILADAALENLEPMNIKIDELAIGGEGWGHVAFDYRPEVDTLVAKRIQGSLQGVKTTDSTLALHKMGKEKWQSSFNGILHSYNIGQVLTSFDQPELIVSKNASFNVSLSWPGYPDEINVNALEGTVDVELTKGRFISGESGGETGFLKLLALLNFDTIVRRLKLDFSDLHPEGLAYDSVTGRLNFDRDYIYLAEETPLRMDTSTVDIQMIGDINIADQTLDTHLVAKLPIAGNLAVAAAVTAGLPAAVGVYVVGKLFKEQVDELTKINYRVTGSWDDPKMSVDNISEAEPPKADPLVPNVSTDTFDIEELKVEANIPESIKPEALDVEREK